MKLWKSKRLETWWLLQASLTQRGSISLRRQCWLRFTRTLKTSLKTKSSSLSTDSTPILPRSTWVACNAWLIGLWSVQRLEILKLSRTLPSFTPKTANLTLLPPWWLMRKISAKQPKKIPFPIESTLLVRVSSSIVITTKMPPRSSHSSSTSTTWPTGIWSGSWSASLTTQLINMASKDTLRLQSVNLTQRSLLSPTCFLTLLISGTESDQRLMILPEWMLPQPSRGTTLAS